MGQKILRLNQPDDIVDGLGVDRQPAVTRLCEHPEALVHRTVDLHRHDIDPRHHDLANPGL